MNKHTPGPWEIVQPIALGTNCRIFGGTRFIASVGNSDNHDHADGSNAMLISQAPKMLEALEKIVARGMPLNPKMLDRFDNEPTPAFKDRLEKYQREWDDYHMARAVIAKAEGA
jgi:hypothetical protein